MSIILLLDDTSTDTGETTTPTIDAFRLELGDLDETRRLYTADQAQYFLDQRDENVLLAVADACDALARRFSREHDVEWQGGPNARTKLGRSQMAKAYADQAAALRKRANSQVMTFSTTRVDGFNEDVDSRSGAGQASPANGRVRAGYTSPDLPV